APWSSLFPYTTLFRSRRPGGGGGGRVKPLGAGRDEGTGHGPAGWDAGDLRCGLHDPVARDERSAGATRRPTLCTAGGLARRRWRSEEHTSELQSRFDL